jgi:hypothetical protein
VVGKKTARYLLARSGGSDASVSIARESRRSHVPCQIKSLSDGSDDGSKDVASEFASLDEYVMIENS